MIYSLAACSPAEPPPNCFCPIAVHPDTVTKDWLANMSPPPSAIDYFHRLGVQQKDIERACGK